MPVLTFTDQRILNVMDFVVKNRIQGVKSEKDFLISIDYSMGYAVNVKKGQQSFRCKHAAKIVEVYGVDANYLLKKSHLKMFPDENVLTPIDSLKSAVTTIQSYLEDKEQEILLIEKANARLKRQLKQKAS